MSGLFGGGDSGPEPTPPAPPAVTTRATRTSQVSFKPGSRPPPGAAASKSLLNGAGSKTTGLSQKKSLLGTG